MTPADYDDACKFFMVKQALKIFIHILIAMLLAQAQLVSYLSSVVHMIEAESAAHFEHELWHLEDRHSDHDYDFSSSSGEHRHSSDGPMHSHAKDLNGSFIQLSLPLGNSDIRERAANTVSQASDYTRSFVSNSHEHSLLRPPIV